MLVRRSYQDDSNEERQESKKDMGKKSNEGRQEKKKDVGKWSKEGR